MPTNSRTNSVRNHRPEIELAWRRAELSGLDPGMEVRATAIADIEKRTSLLPAR
jgi:sigma-54 dependent transcriptional regulator, acetoin dehydrogenase operon transcriptional activator AcoR